MSENLKSVMVASCDFIITWLFINTESTVAYSVKLITYKNFNNLYFFFLEIYSGDYRLSFVQGSNSIGVEFCIQKDAVYLREFNATEKLKQGNSTGKWNKHLTEQEEDNFKKKPQKVWLMEASSQCFDFCISNHIHVFTIII